MCNHWYSLVSKGKLCVPTCTLQSAEVSVGAHWYSTLNRGKLGVPTGILYSARVSYVYPHVLYSQQRLVRSIHWYSTVSRGKLGVSTGTL